MERSIVTEQEKIKHDQRTGRIDAAIDEALSVANRLLRAANQTDLNPLSVEAKAVNRASASTMASAAASLLLAVAKLTRKDDVGSQGL